MRRLAGAAVVLFFALACAQSTSAPLPKDVHIVPPTGVSKEEAFFSGRWVGEWGDLLDSKLVVERIVKNKAFVIYAWGKGEGFGPGFIRTTGTIHGKRLVLRQRPGGPAIAFTLAKGGTLDGTYVLQGRTTTAVFTMQVDNA